MSEKYGYVDIAAEAATAAVIDDGVNAETKIVGSVASNDATFKYASIVPGDKVINFYGNATATATVRINYSFEETPLPEHRGAGSAPDGSAP